MIVVGGGILGLTLSLQLAQRGVACTLVDIECPPPDSVLQRMRDIAGVLGVYAL